MRELNGQFAADVRDALQRSPRQLPSKYFYDELGSALFEAICRLPWYRITRAETAMLARHAREIIAGLPRPLMLAELGCGSGDKLASFAVATGDREPLIHLIDISEAALDMARYRLTAAGFEQIVSHHAFYEEGLAHAVRERPASGAILVLFLGSNIGNFEPPVARAFLEKLRRLLRTGDALLLGSDLVKPERELLLAYDDPLGVTAAFNYNLLRRINDELGGTFDLDGFDHVAAWNPGAGRVEAYLVSRREQRVRVDAAGLDLAFTAGERIWTESSHKYEAADIVSEGAAAGFAEAGQWIDPEARFALTRFLVPA